jgi:DNA-binding LacI/PurR family transcriptional regulator
MGFTPLYQQIKERIAADVLAGPVSLPEGRLPTERELEARYGVSRPTISKALAALAAEGLLVKAPGRGMFAVTPADTIGNGHSRAQGQTPRRIGFVAPISTEALVRRSFSGADRAARRRGYCAILGGSEDDMWQEQEVVRELIASGAQGLVIYPTPRQRDTLAADYLVANPPPVPIVLVDTCVPEQGHTQVVFNNRQAGYDVTSWLLGKGCRRIGVLFYPDEMYHGPLDERLRGYRQAMADHGIAPKPEWIERFVPGVDRDDLHRAVARLVERNPGLDAIIAADDIAALDAIEELEHLGIRVGEQMRVVGFDNRDVARHFRPAFPTTAPDFERMGAMACDHLLDALEGGGESLRTYVMDVPMLVSRSAHRHRVSVRSAAALNPASEQRHNGIGGSR